MGGMGRIGLIGRMRNGGAGRSQTHAAVGKPAPPEMGLACRARPYRGGPPPYVGGYKMAEFMAASQFGRPWPKFTGGRIAGAGRIKPKSDQNQTKQTKSNLKKIMV